MPAIAAVQAALRRSSSGSSRSPSAYQARARSAWKPISSLSRHGGSTNMPDSSSSSVQRNRFRSSAGM